MLSSAVNVFDVCCDRGVGPWGRCGAWAPGVVRSAARAVLVGAWLAVAIIHGMRLHYPCCFFFTARTFPCHVWFRFSRPQFFHGMSRFSFSRHAFLMPTRLSFFHATVVHEMEAHDAALLATRYVRPPHLQDIEGVKSRMAPGVRCGSGC